MTLQDISAEQKEALAWLWRESPKSDKRVVLDAVYTAEGHIHGYKMPTAAKLLEDRGFQVDYLCAPVRDMKVRTGDAVRKADLSEYNVLVVSGVQGKDEFEAGDVNRIQRFVEEGGGLLYCVIRDWHSGAGRNVLERFGVQSRFSYFYDKENCVAGEPMWIDFTDIAPHAISKGVSKIMCMGGRPIQGKGTPVVRSSANSFTAHPWGDAKKDGPQTLVQALEFGKGRVVVVGTDALFRPDDLEMADNRQLFQNIMVWLAEPSLGRTGGAVAELKRLAAVPAAAKSEDMATFWDFEAGADQFDKGVVSDGFGYTGKRSLQAATVAGKPYDVLIQTRWNKAGYCSIPESPHISFAYYADRECGVVVVVESPDQDALCRMKLKAGEWTWVSLPLKGFEKAADKLAGTPLANIQIKGGEPGNGVRLFIDDLSISGGQATPGR
jgi:methylmalonyl-CoA mutase cobalamin-binding subunit